MRLPTAMQRAADVHDTPDRPLNASPGPGVLRTRQVLPFHCSASGSTAPSSVRYPPTAMQPVPLRQAMPGSDMPAVPGCASISCVQEVPSHAIACEAETAMQLAALTQDTADRLPAPGVPACCQVLPFQARARMQANASHGDATSLSVKPTAMQKERVGQDTSDNSLSAPPSGVASSCHFLPFHSSASAISAFESGSRPAPTAMHMDALTQDTWMNPMIVTRHGSRLGHARHLVPFHAAALSHTNSGRDSPEPTAMQNDRRVHEMPTRRRPRGVRAAVQVRPSHRWAGLPRAMQNLALVQEMPDRPVPRAPGTTSHLLPFHFSASECLRPRASAYPPTARQKDALTQEIPAST